MPRMTPREAVEFLAQQATLQAEREGKPLDALEQRMLRWSAVIPGLEHTVQFNDEFEREHDTAEFEEKAAGLLQRARAQAGPTWDDALAALRGQDAYVLVMIRQSGGSAGSNISVLWGVVIGVVLLVGLVCYFALK